MNTPWKSPSQFKAAMDAKDAEIAELQKKLDTGGTDSDASKTLANITALFGEAAKEEDFDLKAVVESVMASNDNAEKQLADAQKETGTLQESLAKAEADLATAQADLETANASIETADTVMGEVAGLLGIERNADTDMVAAVGDLEIAKRENPQEKTKRPKEKSTEADDIHSDFDEELSENLKKFDTE